jgi:hypothetical protein
VDVAVNDVFEVDETASVTLTLYNYLDTLQTVRWEIEPSEDYLVDKAPDNLKVDAEAVASTTLQIIPLITGEIVLDLRAVGDNMVDAIRIVLDVAVP